jgi:hypothetical protein
MAGRPLTLTPILTRSISFLHLSFSALVFSLRGSNAFVPCLPKLASLTLPDSEYAPKTCQYNG